jgi:hypothetical protein
MQKENSEMAQIKKQKDGKTQMTTGIVLAGTAEFGSALVREAVEKNTEDSKQAIVGQVKNRLKEIETQRAFIAECQEREKFLLAQVEAIQSGQFTVDRTGYITFKDGSLETYSGTGRTISIPKCPKCGYSVNLMVSV